MREIIFKEFTSLYDVDGKIYNFNGHEKYQIEDFDISENEASFSFVCDGAEFNSIDSDLIDFDAIHALETQEIDNMDGDHASALASAGYGADEDYEHHLYDDGQ